MDSFMNLAKQALDTYDTQGKKQGKSQEKYDDDDNNQSYGRQGSEADNDKYSGEESYGKPDQGEYDQDHDRDQEAYSGDRHGAQGSVIGVRRLIGRWAWRQTTLRRRSSRSRCKARRFLWSSRCGKATCWRLCRCRNVFPGHSIYPIQIS